jgi:phage shock protein PspC (stress-responsive transcriptional regulator)
VLAQFVLDKIAKIFNKNNVMRRFFFILAVILTQTALAGSALAAPKILSRDGSLVIETPGSKLGKKTPASEDTLYELLGQEVQVYIFNKKTRVWPQVYGHNVQTPFRGTISLKDPQLEALIRKYAQIYGVDPTLVRAVMRHESGFNPSAVSPKGAQGLMQLMSGTAALMGVKNPFDPEQNIMGGVGYLRHCLDRFKHNVPLAVAAYNAGPESVAKCGAIPPYQETQAFVNNVMGAYGGPSLMKTGAQGDAKTVSPTPKKGAKSRPKDPKPEDLQAEKSSDPPRRPPPKIIEVRSYKTKSKDGAAD